MYVCYVLLIKVGRGFLSFFLTLSEISLVNCNQVNSLTGHSVRKVRFCDVDSTISSGLNSLAAVCLQDLLRLICFKDMSERRATLASKLLCMYRYSCFPLTLILKSYYYPLSQSHLLVRIKYVSRVNN